MYWKFQKFVAIPSFFQGISTSFCAIASANHLLISRNPFFFSGHFNASILRMDAGSVYTVAIPSFFQGIST